MSEHRKNQILEEFRRPPTQKSSRSKDIKSRLHHLRSKETFLTDTQNSDYTRSSGQIHIPRTEQMQQTIRQLEKQNSQLKQRIVELKTNQFFEINQEKLKGIIKQTQKLREQLQLTQKSLEESLVERDFLERFNKNLKTQCESLTKQILILRGNSNNLQSKKSQKNIYTSREETQSNKSRSSHKEGRIPYKRKDMLYKKSDKERDQSSGHSTNNTLLKSSLSASILHEDYYGSKTNRSRHKPLKYC